MTENCIVTRSPQHKVLKLLFCYICMSHNDSFYEKFVSCELVSKAQASY